MYVCLAHLQPLWLFSRDTDAVAGKASTGGTASLRGLCKAAGVHLTTSERRPGAMGKCQDTTWMKGACQVARLIRGEETLSISKGSLLWQGFWPMFTKGWCFQREKKKKNQLFAWISILLDFANASPEVGAPHLLTGANHLPWQDEVNAGSRAWAVVGFQHQGCGLADAFLTATIREFTF